MRLLAVLLLALLTAAGCGTDEDDTLTVLAAASLTEVFEELAADFEATHPGVEVKLAFGSSATLVEQVAEGAPADVLAGADERTWRDAQAAGVASDSPVLFASNVMVLAVPQDNPAGIDGVADLRRGDVEYVACVTTAPCGAAADRLLEAAGVARAPASQEPDVKAVLARVVAAEADAGLVYRSDAVGAGDAVTALEVPGAETEPNAYWADVVSDAAEPELAHEWLQMLQTPDARKVLSRAGFGP